LAIPTETAILNRRSSVYLNKGNSPTATRRFAILDKHHWRIVADLGNGVFMRVWNVGIVGGGPGGLMTAYTLQKLANSPLRVTLYEAGPRLGGKILTPCFRSLPIRYEAGAAEFYDYSQFDDDSLKSLIAELGLPVRPMGGPAVVINHRILANLDDLRDELAYKPSKRCWPSTVWPRTSKRRKSFIIPIFPTALRSLVNNAGSIRCWIKFPSLTPGNTCGT
jgi:hypothetical protein